MNSILQKLTYGYYIVTALKPADELKTREKDYLAAATVNWITQLSFDPPMIGVAVGLKADVNETIDYSNHFTIHVLSKKQKDWIEKFSEESTVKDNRINGIPFEKKDHALILPGTIGHITCKLEKSMNNGDHTFHIGRIVDHQLNEEDAAPYCTKEQAPRYRKEKAEV
jgi:flavin reductase (DIM6/NTAB) family NADH-FMN oxidoreductase RutF